MTKKLNLTEAERNSVVVTFSVNKFVATFGEHDALLGTYMSKTAMKEDFKRNEIKNPQIRGLAVKMYLSNYGG